MGKPLTIPDPRAHELAQELADRRKTGIAEAVIVALENELRREEAAPLAERLEQIAREARAKAGPNPRDLSEDERDAMWTRF